jgi:hypothetical protein
MEPHAPKVFQVPIRGYVSNKKFLSVEKIYENV